MFVLTEREKTRHCEMSIHRYSRGFPGGSNGNLPAMQETWIQSLGWEDALEREMATHSTFLPGKSHGQRSLAGSSPWGSQESDTTE